MLLLMEKKWYLSIVGRLQITSKWFKGAIYKKFKIKQEAQNFIKENTIQSFDDNNIDYYVYTDGACSNNGSKDAVAGIGIYFGPNDTKRVFTYKIQLDCGGGHIETLVLEVLGVFASKPLISREQPPGPHFFLLLPGTGAGVIQTYTAKAVR